MVLLFLGYMYIIKKKSIDSDEGRLCVFKSAEDARFVSGRVAWPILQPVTGKQKKYFLKKIEKKKINLLLQLCTFLIQEFKEMRQERFFFL